MQQTAKPSIDVDRAQFVLLHGPELLGTIEVRVLTWLLLAQCFIVALAPVVVFRLKIGAQSLQLQGADEVATGGSK